LGAFAEKVTKLFGYEWFLPMNTGAEAVETGIKLAANGHMRRKASPKGALSSSAPQGISMAGPSASSGEGSPFNSSCSSLIV